MTDTKAKNLWGEEFRVVEEGLAETDVVIFVEKMMRRHRKSLRKLDHIEALHELATKTVEDAEQLAGRVIDEARKAAETQTGRIMAQAGEQAKAVLHQAEKQADKLAESRLGEVDALRERARRKVRERMAGIESALRALEEAATRELSARMPSHYIGKHLYQSVHFLPAFQDLIKEVEAGTSKEERDSLLEAGPDAPPTSPDLA